MDNWKDHLPWVMLGLRSAAREDNNKISAQAVFGSPFTSSNFIFLTSFR
jgi:hypothetical protein